MRKASSCPKQIENTIREFLRNRQAIRKKRALSMLYLPLREGLGRGEAEGLLLAKSYFLISFAEIWQDLPDPDSEVIQAGDRMYTMSRGLRFLLIPLLR